MTALEKAATLVKGLPVHELVNLAKTGPEELLNVVLNELESRMSESEFVALCNTL